MQKPLKITIFGAGAMGTTLAAWMTAAGQNVSLVARGENARRLKQQPIRILNGDEVLLGDTQVNVVDHINAVGDVDVLIITVKNFDLDECCQQIIKNISTETLVLGLQNGVVNQVILPKYFSNVVYAISNYNAWQEPATINTGGDSLDWKVNVNGPIILGTPDNQFQSEVRKIAALFSSFIACQHSMRFCDDAYAKLVSNLANSVTTLIGNSHHEEASLIPLQAVLTRITYEGLLTLRAAGFRPPSKSALPPWWVVKLGEFMPSILTRPMFRRKIAMVGSTSMASDVLLKNTGQSELESINGVMLELAQKHNVDVPYSRKLYKLCKDRFGKVPFQPISATELKNYLDA